MNLSNAQNQIENEDCITTSHSTQQKTKKSKAFICKICNKTYSVKDTLKVHTLTIHEKKFSFPCTEPNCNKQYFNKYKLQCHLLSHTGKKPFQCTHCDKSFTTKGNLTSHQKRLHDKHAPKYQCNVCGKFYTSNGNRTNHYNIVHLNQRKFNCHICKKKFGRQSTLQTHLILHSGIKPFECPIKGCGKKYGEKGNLSTHIKIKHPESYGVKYSNQRGKETYIDNGHCLKEQCEDKGCELGENLYSAFEVVNLIDNVPELSNTEEKSTLVSLVLCKENGNSLSDGDNEEDGYCDTLKCNSMNSNSFIFNSIRYYMNNAEDDS